MKQLVKNELIKLRAQKTYVVLSCIVLALVVIVSFFTSVLLTPLSNLIAYGEDMFTESAAYEWAVEQIKDNPDGAFASVLRVIFKNPRSDGDKMREQAQEEWDDDYKSGHAVYMAQAKYYDFRDENDLDNWIGRAVQNDLTGLYIWREVYEGVQSGIYTLEDMANDYYLFYLLIEFNYTETYLPYDLHWDYDPVTGDPEIGFYRYNDMGLAEECEWSEVWNAVSTLKPTCDAMIGQIEQYAKELEPDAYYDSLIQQQNAEIRNYEDMIAQHQQAIKELDEKQELEREYYEQEIETYRGMIEDRKQVVKAYTYLKEQGSSPDGNAFALVNNLLPGVLEGRRNSIVTLAQAEQSEDFVLLVRAIRSSQTIKIRTYDKALVAIEHLYTHDILPEGMSASGAKATFINNLSVASFLIGAVTIVFASMILSREFATGTVRLWVIRPKTRSKLLGSKIVTLLIYVCCMMGASFVITFAFALVNHLLDLFFYGESTLFAAVYGVVFGQVVSIPAIAELAWAFVILTLPIILYAMLCLLVSVLTKKGVLSIVFGMLVLMFATDIQALTLIVANYTGAFGYVLQATVLPYLSMDRLLITALDFGISALTMGSLDGLGALMGLETMIMSQFWGAAPYACSTFVGAAVLTAHILLLIWLSLVAFKKTQIKS